MNILEQFVVLFTSNTDGLKDGAKEARKELDDLTQSLEKSETASTKSEAAAEDAGKAIKDVGEEASKAAEEISHINEEAVDMQKNLKQLAKDAAPLLAAYLAMRRVFQGMRMVADVSEDIGNVSRSIGVSAQDLHAWGRAATTVGGSVDGLQGSVLSLNQSLFDLYMYGDSAILPALMRLGIGFDQFGKFIENPMEMLPALAEAFERLPEKETFALGMQLGLDEGTIRLLQQGREATLATVEAQRAYGMVTEEDARISRDFNNSLRALGFAMQGLFRILNSVLLPPLTSFLNVMGDFFALLRQHETFTKVFFGGLAAMITLALIPSIVGLTKAFDGLIIRLAIMMAPLLLKIGAIVGGIAALALVWDDFVTYAKGGASVIGDLERAFGRFWQRLKDNPLQTIIDLFKELDRLISGNSMVKYFVGIEGEQSGVSLKEGGLADMAIKGLMGLFGGNTSAAAAQSAITGAASTPLASVPSGSMGLFSANRTANVSIGTLNVETRATDASGVASGIGSALRDEINRAQNQFDDGIDR